MVCPCLFGLESVLARELKYIDAQEISVTDGKVYFKGSFTTLIDANINLRTAERVLIVMDEFKATTFEELFQRVFAINWAEFIGKYDQFPVKGWSLNSTLKSVPTCQSIIKKAIVEKLKKSYNINTFEESKTLYQVQFSIHKNKVSIMLDSSGVGLYKRGYRKTSVLAPIKETLAAGIVSLARVNVNSCVYDPCCGSGTLLIEACLYALKIAPGLNRYFASESWNIIPKQDWYNGRQKAIAKINKNALFRAFGSDIDTVAIDVAKNNALKAGVASKINFELKSISNFKTQTESAIILCNPPYGERMLELKDAKNIYETMGQKFIVKNNHSYYIISPDENFEKLFGKQATKRRKLYNGMLKCQLYMYF